MLELAAGWIGWSEEQALKTDVNYIMFAYKGRMSMLKAIFGSSNEQEEERKPPDKNQILSFVKTHNALYHHGRLRGVKPPPKK